MKLSVKSMHTHRERSPSYLRLPEESRTFHERKKTPTPRAAGVCLVERRTI
ncbi:hypothetical protein OAD56_03515 [Gammaproteobacteria bacterium]|nr:hypothetical protein [Gammaproteobacteria bacterium]MDB9950451.1 hypothetical protein [Gammaproteobacteria bacterium]